jgi:hypothetical protein
VLPSMWSLVENPNCPQPLSRKTSAVVVEMVERVTKAILPAFTHIHDPEYRKTIAMCWARAAMSAMDLPTEEMIITGDEAALEVLNDHSFALRDETLASKVYRAMVKISHKPDEN